MSIPVSSNIVAGGSAFAATDISQVKGATQIVADDTARDAIPASRRQIGMKAHCLDSGKTYRLVGGIENTDWVESGPIQHGASDPPTHDPGISAAMYALTNASKLWFWNGTSWLQIIGCIVAMLLCEANAQPILRSFYTTNVPAPSEVITNLLSVTNAAGASRVVIGDRVNSTVYADGVIVRGTNALGERGLWVGDGATAGGVRVGWTDTVQTPDRLLCFTKVSGDTNEHRLLSASYGAQGCVLIAKPESGSNASNVSVSAYYGEIGVPSFGSGLRFTTAGSAVGVTSDPGSGKNTWAALTTNEHAALSSGYLVMAGYYAGTAWPIAGASAYLQVWRNVGASSTLVAEQEITDLVTKPAEMNYFRLDPSIEVQDGDRAGLAVTYDGTHWGYCAGFSGPTPTNSTLYFQSTSTLVGRPSDGFNWTNGLSSLRELEIETFISSTPYGSESLGDLAPGENMSLPVAPQTLFVRAQHPLDGVLALIGVPANYTQLARADVCNARGNHFTYSSSGATSIGSASDPGSGKIYSAAVSYSTQTRVTRPGLVKSVKIPVTAVPANSQWWFQLWRNVGASSILVGEEDVTASIVGGTGQRTCVLTNTLYAQQWDYPGVCMKYDGTNWGTCIQMGAVVSGDGSGFYNATLMLTDKPADGHNWTGGANQSSRATQIEVVIADSPMVVAIGDSLVAGRYSGASSSQTNVNVLSMPSEYMSTQLGVYVENMGIGSQQSTDIAARFDADVIAKKPKVVWIHCGINDLSYLFQFDPVTPFAPTDGEIAAAKADFLDAMDEMITSALAADIRVAVTRIIPWDPDGVGAPWMDSCLPDGNATLRAVCDDWMDDLAEYIATLDQSMVLLVDSDGVLGDENNYLKDEYQRVGDGYIHLNQLGSWVWGVHLSRSITAWLKSNGTVL